MKKPRANQTNCIIKVPITRTRVNIVFIYYSIVNMKFVYQVNV